MLLTQLHFKLLTGAHLLLMEHQLCQLHFQHSPDSQGKEEDCHADQAPLQNIQDLNIGDSVWALDGGNWLRGTVVNIGPGYRNAKISTGGKKAVMITDPAIVLWRKE